MKKIITLLAVIGMFSFQSCTTTDPYVDNDTIPEAFEIKGVYLGRVLDNEYNYSSTFQKEIGGNLFDDETVLVYRKTGALSSGAPIWQLIPRTINFNNGDFLEYYFDFSKVDFVITAYGNYNLLYRSSYIDDQTFRIVIIPSDLSVSVNKNNYNEVMNALKINESQVQKINF